MSNKMLQQAIIDANALKEVALKNAEATIIEKYSRQIKEAVDNMLEQDEDEDIDAAEAGMDSAIGGEIAQDDLGLDAGAEGAPESAVGDQLPLGAVDGEKLCPCPEEEEPIEIDFEDLQNMMQQVDSDESPMAGPTPAEVLPSAPGEEMALEEDEDGVMFELDDLRLDEEDDVDDQEKAEAAVQAAEEKTADPSLKEDFENEDNEERRDHDRDAAKDDWDHIVKLARDAHQDHVARSGDEGDEDEEGRDRHRDAAEDDWAHIDALARDAHEDREDREDRERISESAKINKKKAKKILTEHANLNKNNKNLIAENTTLKNNQKKLLGENKGFRVLLEKLSHTLESVNLSNAKLIYTNQILGSNSLNERQKMKIVEAINDADSVETAKAVFETLQSAVGPSSNDGPKSLSEVVSNNSATMFKRTEKKQSKTDSYTSRMKKLAGI